jgi:hypothetical protein
LSTSPVVERKTTASYCARLAVVNAAPSSVAVTAKSFAAPSSWIAWIPAGMESCRNPAVLEKTSTFSSGSEPGSSTVTVPDMLAPCTSHRNV